MTKEIIKPKKKMGNPNIGELGKATRFQPGNQLAKGKGRPTMTPEEQALSISTRTQLKTVMLRYITWDVEKIEMVLEEKKSNLPVLDIMILKALLSGAVAGSMITLDWITDHIMGKKAAEAKIDLSGAMQNTTTNTIDLSRLSIEDLTTLKAIAEKSQQE